MNERICFINKSVIIDKIFVPRVVGRINVNQVNPAPVGLLQQTQSRQIIPFQQEVHLAAVVDQQRLFLRQHRSMLRQHRVDGLLVFLENQAVLLAIHVPLQVGEIGQQTASVLVLGRGGDVGPDSGNFRKQIFPLLFGEVGGHISFLQDVSVLLPQFFL